MKKQNYPKNLPDSPGVYLFLGRAGKILYIGKATSIHNRVRSYFSEGINEKRSPLIGRMVEQAVKISFRKTDSVLEALILEANLVKKYLPPANTDLKDQKSWNFVVITDEDFPRVLVVRERNLKLVLSQSNGLKIRKAFGPFPHGGELREALKIIRKIFPYRDAKCAPNQGRPCFNRQIGLCPGVCTGEVSKKEYAKTIRHIEMFFQGKLRILSKRLEGEMKKLARERKFEEAAKIKKQIFSLKHINDVALLKANSYQLTAIRIEAYDISHISGSHMVGVMTVVEGGEARSNDYRLFNIKNQKGADDTKALSEILERRLKHREWPLPNLVVVDGGEAQINVARKELEKAGLKIQVVGVVKDERHKAKEIRPAKSEARGKNLAQKYEKEILLANSESHRFAIKSFRRHLYTHRAR